jgi:hypothetical protein
MSRARFGTTGQGCRRSVVVFAVFCSKISAKCRLSASDSLGFRSACVSENSEELGCSWLFLAVFERARPAADRTCMAAGDYQFDSEIASRNSYFSNYLEGRSGAWPSLCHAPQTAASVSDRSSGRAPTSAWQRLNPIRGSARGQP